MCLVLIDKEKKDLTKEELISLFKKTNNSTITAYKLLDVNYDGTLITPYQFYSIELNTHYYNEGRNKFTFDKVWNILEVHEGLHAYTSLEKAKNRCIGGRIIVKCIIPKGSEYFINKTKHEICSDNLIITDQIVYSNSLFYNYYFQ